MVGRREEKRREERERERREGDKGRVKGRKDFFYCEGLRVWLVFFIGWRDYVALSRTEREGLSWFGIERDMETTLDLLYTEKAPNTTPFFCFGVRVNHRSTPDAVSFNLDRTDPDSETDGEALLEETLEEEILEEANLVDVEVKAEQ
ncbi:hypothetical protein VIGAN_10075600 [Vigna angularis var. angularis]|uniref:Uncharacterized protein n=1 Tax=Vigna angularis var. angularis TaxID=157739 RepID=A0A0S3T2R0_PHAAN|nr:hypothetical protein VIGAN_10075600 [Vigna angularis var. angularis]